MKLKQAVRFGLAAAGLLWPIGIARSQNADIVTPPEVLADQVRSQGYPCAQALSSQRDGDKPRRRTIVMSTEPALETWKFKLNNTGDTSRSSGR